MNLTEYKNIWVYAECFGREPTSVYYELLSKAKELVDGLGGTKVCSVVLGSNTGDAVSKVAASGTDIVYCVDHPKLADYNVDFYSAALQELIDEYKPEAFLIGATAIGSELAPTVAAKVRTGVAAHCVDIYMNDERQLISLVPAFGGKVVSEILVPEHRPQIASVRPGILSAEELKANPEVSVVSCSCPALDDCESGVKLIGYKPTEASGLDLEKADFVICAGRGVANDAAWKDINELAEKTCAAVGNTRGLFDAEIVPDESDVIGTSGKSIKPKACLVFGASGAMHFVNGIVKSNMIISVNRDEKAAIFDVSDYKVVGDAGKIIKALINKLDA